MKEIYERRSIRKYNNKEIDNEIITEILKAGMNAPSAMNKKPYELIVIKNKETLSKLSKIKPNAHMLEECNFAIAVIGLEDKSTCLLDTGALIENMLLMAKHFGIGSCWIGVTDEEIKQELNVDTNKHLISMVSFGYPNENKESNNNYYEEKVTYIL